MVDLPEGHRPGVRANQAEHARQELAASREGDRKVIRGLLGAGAPMTPQAVVAAERENNKYRAQLDFIIRRDAARQLIEEFLRSHPDAPMIEPENDYCFQALTAAIDSPDTPAYLDNLAITFGALGCWCGYPDGLPIYNKLSDLATAAAPTCEITIAADRPHK